jgi:uncharacterized protein YeaO (DUF488 family)
MPIRVVQLGTPRLAGEGIRIGTVRRPPRGVRKNRYAAENYFDVWLPNLAPSAEVISAFRKNNDDAGWKRFTAQYKSEMKRPENSRLLDTLAALSHTTNFSVGCYCDNEQRCHRSLLRTILIEHGAAVAD